MIVHLEFAKRHLKDSDHELERICREEWEKLPKYNCAKLVASYPTRLKAVIAAKGASTNYCVKGLNTYINVIFHVISKNLFLPLSLWVLCVD